MLQTESSTFALILFHRFLLIQWRDVICQSLYQTTKTIQFEFMEDVGYSHITCVYIFHDIINFTFLNEPLALHICTIAMPGIISIDEKASVQPSHSAHSGYM